MTQASQPSMREVLDIQRAAFTKAMPEPLSVRTDRLSRAIAMMLEHKHDFAKAI